MPATEPSYIILLAGNFELGSCHDVRMNGAVVFDLGGVLARVARNWAEAGTKIGLNLDSDRATAPLSLDPVLHAFQAAETTEAEYHAQLAEWLDTPAEAAPQIHGAILIYEYDGALDLVTELRAAGVRTASLSNTNEPHWQILLDPAFHPAIAALDVPLASHRLQAAKPDPRAYIRTEEEVGTTSITFFDDTGINIPPAQARGWQAFHVPAVDNPIPWIRAKLVEVGHLR